MSFAARIRGQLCQACLISLYWLATCLSRATRKLPRHQAAESRTVLVIGTFYNSGWFRAHIDPILASNVFRVLLITDTPLDARPNLTFVCPPRWLSRLISRAGARLLFAVYLALRDRPAVVMGYHIFPAGLIALVAARLAGSVAAFQLTGGPGEWEGGGWQMENPLLAGLGCSRSKAERAAIRLVSEMDWVVVRGTTARQSLHKIGFSGMVSVITGSVDVPDQVADLADRDIDVITVGRLEEVKRLDRFIDVIAALPDLGARAVIVGDGALRAELARTIDERGLTNRIELLGRIDHPTEWLLRSKTFLLTSRSEGVSIALLEAMACGCVPFATDVGDLKDFVRNGETGFLFPPRDLPQVASRIDELLGDPERWRRLSDRARDAVVQLSSIHALAERWRSELERSQCQGVAGHRARI